MPASANGGVGDRDGREWEFVALSDPWYAPPYAAGSGGTHWHCCVGPGRRQATLRFGWESANFDLYTDAGEASARTMIRNFERVHSFLRSRGLGDRARRRVWQRSIGQGISSPYRFNEVAAAYFPTRDDAGLHRLDAGSLDLIEHPETAVHEYTHLMVRQSKKEIPVWLNEGLAELYSNMQPQGKKVLVGSPIGGRLQSLVNDQWIGLDKLTAAGHDSPFYTEKNRAGIFYAESWLLVHMLFLDSDYRPHYHDMAVALEQSGSAPEAFQKAYGKSAAAVEKDLHAYIRRNTVSALVFDVDLPKSSGGSGD